MRPGRGMLESGTTILNPLICVWPGACAWLGERYAPTDNAIPAINKNTMERFMRHSSFELALNWLEWHFGSEFKPHGIVHRLGPPAARDFAEFDKIDEVLGFDPTICSDHASHSPGMVEIV